MQIGIISDIHGDYDALTIALNRLRNYHAVEHILCAGDLVGRGPKQNRVVQTIRNQSIISVRGNHDEWFHKLEPENTSFLRELPLDWSGRLGGRSIYMCHGKPGNNMWGMYRDHLSDTYLNMVLGSLRADVLITGHTHIPLYMRVDEGCIVNPGSLYYTFDTSRKTSASYGVLNLDDLNFEVYDLTAESIQAIELESA
ncbi:metallophosphoesterase family protein [Anaerolineales bacterium]